MKRQDFLKLTGLSLFGVTSGLNANPIIKNLFFEEEKFHMPKNKFKDIILTKDEMWFGWLAKVVASSLISTLVGKIVERYTGDCVCDETSCKLSPPNYSNAVGIYGYNNGSSRFVTQNVIDPNVNFTNVSVPFLTNNNVKIGNVEGPHLAGLCWATESMAKTNSTNFIRKNLIPTYVNKNGGYRFDLNGCYSTEYITESGKAKISYENLGYNKGKVRVETTDHYDNLTWREGYNFDYA